MKLSTFQCAFLLPLLYLFDWGLQLPATVADYAISGQITSAAGVALQGVNIELGGHQSATTITQADGTYIFTALPEGFDYTLTASDPASANIEEGLSVYDMLLIRRAILGIDELDNPCQTLAADVNASTTDFPSADLNGVSTFDQVLIGNALRGIILSFEPAWEFFLPDSNFYGAQVQSFTVDINNLSADTNIDLLAVKAGDVSACGAVPNIVPPSLNLQADANIVVPTGTMVGIDIKNQGFSNIAGLQFSIRWDPAVLQYASSSNFNLMGGLSVSNLGETQTGTGILRFVWTDANAAGLTLPDGAALFKLNFNVVGMPGSFSPITIAQDPLPFEVVDGNMNISSLIPQNGLVTVQSPMIVSINGTITQYGGLPGSGFEVNLSGSATASQTTDTNGQYAFNGLANNGDYTVTPSSSTSNCTSSCIDVLDLYLIQRHILGLSPLPSPYAMMAADVNSSSTITTQDIIVLRQLILGATSTFANATCWRFVDASYVFPNPANPFAELAPASVVFNNLNANAQADFVAIRTGDVSGCTEAVNANALVLEANFDAPVCPDDHISVPVVVQNFDGVAAMQFTLRWDPAVLAFEGILNFGLPGLTNANFGQAPANTDNGLLTMVWVESNGGGLSLPDGTVLVDVLFNVIGNPGEASSIGFSDTPLATLAVDGQGLAGTVNTTGGMASVNGASFVMGPAYCFEGNQFISFYTEGQVSGADGENVFQDAGNDGYWMHNLPDDQFWLIQIDDNGPPPCRRFQSGTAGACSDALTPDCANPLKLTNNSGDDDQAVVWGSFMAWQGFDGTDYEIYLLNLNDPAAAPVPITNNTINDWRPALSGNSIVWEQEIGPDREILLVSLDNLAALPLNLSNDPSNNDASPQIAGNFVVWHKNNDLYYYDIGAQKTDYLATTGSGSSRFSMWGNTVVWEALSGGDLDIFAADLFNPGAIQTLSNNAYEDSQPKIYDKYVVWVGYPGVQGDIYAYELGISASPQLLSPASAFDNAPDLQGQHVVWAGQDGGDYEIFHFDLGQLGTGSAEPLSNNTSDDFSPSIWGNHVVWNTTDGDNLYLPLDMPGETPFNMTLNAPAFAEPPQVHGHLAYWRSSDTEPELFMFDLTLAPPPAPELDGMVSDILGLCPGEQATLALQTIGNNLLEPQWFDDEQMTTLLYSDIANMFQPVLNSSTTYYAAWRNSFTGCIGPLTPVILSPAATDNLACNDQILVALDNQCTVTTDAAQILEGSYGCLETSDFVVTVNDSNPGNGAVVDGAGTYNCTVSLATGVTGNFTSCFTSLTALDNLAPILACPPNQEVQAQAGQSSAAVTWPDPIAADNCQFTINSSHLQGSQFPVGQTQVTYTIVDDSGNISNCEFTVNVTQALASVVFSMPDVMTTVGQVVCLPVTVDNFADIAAVQFSITFDPALVQFVAVGNLALLPGLDNSDFDLPGSGVITFSWFDADGSGESLPNGATLFEVCFEALSAGTANVDFSNTPTPIEVVEASGGTTLQTELNNGSIAIAEPFVLVCPGDIVQINDPAQCSATVNVPTILIPEPGTLTNDFNGTGLASGVYPVGTTAVTYTFTSDLTGLSSSCTLNVTVQDTEPPLLQCPPDVSVTAAAGQSEAVVSFGSFQLSDNCGEAILNCSHITGSLFPCGVTTVNCSATDTSGNISAPCSFLVNVDCVEADYCPGLSLQPSPLDSTGACCWSLDYENTGTEDVFGIEIVTLDGVTLDFDLSSSDYFTPNQTDTSVLVTPDPLGSPIPTQVDDLLSICLGHVLATPQYVVVNYYDSNFEVFCSDTLTFQCPIERTCLYIVSDSLVCDTNGYKYTATVANPPGGFDVGFIKFNITNPASGVSFDPSPVAYVLSDTLQPGEQTTLMFTIQTSADLFGDSLCFVLSAHDGVEERLCCAEIDTCIAFPQCDPCPYLGAEIQPTDSLQANECCFSLYYTDTLATPGLVTGLTVGILNPGINFSGIEALEALLNGWSHSPAMPANTITWTHNTGSVPTGINNYLFDFCVEGLSTTDSIYIQLDWLGADLDTICTDTLALYCPSCLAVVNDSIVCKTAPDGSVDYQYNFQVTNYSSFVVNAIGIVEIPSSATEISPDLITIAPLQPYDPGPPAMAETSAPVSILIDGAYTGGDTVCFDLVLRQIIGDSIDITCCYVRHCIVLPPCDTFPPCDSIACVPPPDVSIECANLPSDFDPFNLTQLQLLFGIPQISGDCPGASWQELAPLSDLMDCQGGTIIRNFVAIDGAGNVSTNICQQVVTIIAGPPAYTIRFPADVVVDCETFADLSLEIGGAACDLLAINYTDDTLATTNGECFKVSRRWHILNWCEYDGSSGPVIVSRDENCNGQQGEEDVWILVRPSGVVYVDQDNDENNGIPVAGIRSNTCDGLTNPGGHWVNSLIKPALASVGFWEYTQIISVVDNTPPNITVATPLPAFCINNNNNCTGPVVIPFTVSETCPLAPPVVRAWIDLASDATLDMGVQLESNGSLTTLAGLPGVISIVNLGGGNYSANAVNIPLGAHMMILEVVDPCGASQTLTLSFSMTDCSPPPIVCINGLVGSIAGLVDTDGNGVPDAPGIILTPDLFLDSPSVDCSPPVTYSINIAGQPVIQSQTSIAVTCNELGLVNLEIHAWDAAGNEDFCQTNFLLTDPLDLCAPAPPPGTENEAPILLYPNPATSTLWLWLPAGNWTDMSLVSPEGHTLENRRPGRQQLQRINTDRLTPGLYFVKLRDENGAIRFARFVRQ